MRQTIHVLLLAALASLAIPAIAIGLLFLIGS